MKAIISVDDDQLITQVLKFQLAKHFDPNEVIIESLNSPEMTEALVDEITKMGIDVALLIVDYQMPKMNGAQLIRVLQSKFPELRYIMLSGQANDIVVEELMNEKLINAFLHKPWNEDSLINLVKQFVV
jgi:two-component system response regulator YesN